MLLINAMMIRRLCSCLTCFLSLGRGGRPVAIQCVRFCVCVCVCVCVYVCVSEKGHFFIDMYRFLILAPFSQGQLTFLSVKFVFKTAV